MNSSTEIEIQECIFLNYEDLRNELVNKYNTLLKIKKDNETIFEPEINKQFLNIVHSFVSNYIHTRTMVTIEDAKIYVEDRFTFDNVERIISEDGRI